MHYFSLCFWHWDDHFKVMRQNVEIVREYKYLCKALHSYGDALVEPSPCSIDHSLSPLLPAISDSRPAVLVQSTADVHPMLSTPIFQTDSLWLISSPPLSIIHVTFHDLMEGGQEGERRHYLFAGMSETSRENLFSFIYLFYLFSDWLFSPLRSISWSVHNGMKWLWERRPVGLGGDGRTDRGASRTYGCLGKKINGAFFVFIMWFNDATRLIEENIS